MIKYLICRIFHKSHIDIVPYMDKSGNIPVQKLATKLKCYKCGIWHNMKLVKSVKPSENRR